MNIISILKNLFRCPKPKHKYWDEKYKEWDEEGEDVLKYYCLPALKQIEEDKLDIRSLRYYFYHIQSYRWYKCSNNIQKEYKNTLYRIWRYATVKGYLESGIDYDTFCTSSVAIFKSNGSITTNG